jgi:hypothetical protein
MPLYPFILGTNSNLLPAGLDAIKLQNLLFFGIFFYSSAQLIANRASAISFAVSNFFSFWQSCKLSIRCNKKTKRNFY